MHIFTNNDIKSLFVRISGISGGFLLLSQLMVWRFYGTLNPVLLIFSILAVLWILSILFFYFKRQDQVLEKAINQIDVYLSGDKDVRIECGREGSLYKLFHAVNTLATALNAHAQKEQKVKEFLKSTISDISHQLKTPIAALNIYNGILQDEAEDTTVIREFALKSEKEIDRMEVLVQNLLKIAKLDAGAMITEKSSEKIADIMNDICRNFEFRADQEKKTIAVSGSEEAELYCDRDWITEAVGNIVKNALDHTDQGGRIFIEWRRRPQITQITVKDNGCGIHPEDIHHIFKRFYRSRFSKDTQGIGLGLPLAKAIIEAHGGNITADSVLGEGSVFVINFPDLTEL